MNRADRLANVAARVLDIRAEFEAQLRGVTRIEEQLRRHDAHQDHRAQLEATLRRELRGMLENNRNVRSVLDDLLRDADSLAVGR